MRITSHADLVELRAEKGQYEPAFSLTFTLTCLLPQLAEIPQGVVQSRNFGKSLDNTQRLRILTTSSTCFHFFQRAASSRRQAKEDSLNAPDWRRKKFSDFFAPQTESRSQRHLLLHGHVRSVTVLLDVASADEQQASGYVPISLSEFLESSDFLSHSECHVCPASQS